MPREVAKTGHIKLDQRAPLGTPGDLERDDAIVVGTPTCFGRIGSQMAAFRDAAGGLGTAGAQVGKVDRADASADALRLDDRRRNIRNASEIAQRVGTSRRSLDVVDDAGEVADVTVDDWVGTLATP